MHTGFHAHALVYIDLTEGFGMRPLRMSSQLGLMTAISYVKHAVMTAHSANTSTCTAPDSDG